MSVQLQTGSYSTFPCVRNCSSKPIYLVPKTCMAGSKPIYLSQFLKPYTELAAFYLQFLKHIAYWVLSARVTYTTLLETRPKTALFLPPLRYKCIPPTHPSTFPG